MLLKEMPKVRHLIYLSCSLGSLARDLTELTAGSWQVVTVQPFDFFPRTRHLETLVLLKNRAQD
jgi:tRNA/tmRNA/rRNA uracil-C5-methylase (TrmA/RlmC/RlmD family)